ncbi:hypothetical protein LMH87_007319 [Akanthomyces muscarius]|uniref:WW domain-containing protein n=1 Tax=Akanthomyces muscarius TaxID=2231603 RepID=A0A9W8QS16_AKAMU|nr:hypothetical protein LMH87_007319 [Akanthomyces muscarius]KAJ4165696.1 hypothetical protein LMH87_007319 [Akanthomyces muscarius]
MPAGLASGLPAGWEWDYDGTRWFYTFKANGHTQYHFPSEGDEFPDFVAVGEPVPDLKPEERLESHQQVKRVTGVAPLIDRKKKSTAGNGMTATARPVGIEWDGDVGEGSSGEEEEGKKAVVFQPENLMFLGPQTYAEVSPLNEDEEEAAKRTVVGVVKGQGEGAVVSPAETTAGTPAVDKSELVRDVPEAKKEEEGRKNEAAEVVIMAEVAMPETAKEEPTTRQEEARAEDAKDTEEPARAPVQQGETITAQPMSPAAQHDVVIDVVTETDTPPPAHYAHDEPPPPPVVHPQQQPRYELPAPDTPFNPVGLIAEMPTEDTPRSHIEINPIPVEIMDTSVLAPIETAQPPPLGVAESPAAVVKQTPPPPPQQRSSSGGAPRMHMKIRRKPTDPNASIPSPLSASSSAVVSPAVVSPPSVASPSPMSVPTPPPPAAAPVAAKAQYKPYAPVSPLHRAETEPVRVPTATTGPAAQREQQESVTEPSSPVANPQLNYAPTVLRPAGQSRKSSSVSPERKQDDGGLKQGESMGGGRVQSGGMPTQESGSNVAALGGMPRQQIPPPGQDRLHSKDKWILKDLKCRVLLKDRCLRKDRCFIKDTWPFKDIWRFKDNLRDLKDRALFSGRLRRTQYSSPYSMVDL